MGPPCVRRGARGRRPNSPVPDVTAPPRPTTLRGQGLSFLSVSELDSAPRPGPRTLRAPSVVLRWSRRGSRSGDLRRPHGSEPMPSTTPPDSHLDLLERPVFAHLATV